MKAPSICRKMPSFVNAPSICSKRGELMHCATPPIGSEFQLLLPWLAFSRPLGLPACIKPIFLYISKRESLLLLHGSSSEPSRAESSLLNLASSLCNIAPNRLTQLCVQKREWPRCWTYLLSWLFYILASFVCLLLLSSLTFAMDYGSTYTYIPISSVQCAS